jgi:hypothetical protein
VALRNKLEKLTITQAWSLRETDLYDYQRQLDKIDESRVDGNWLDEEGKPAELYVQRVWWFPMCLSFFRTLTFADLALSNTAKLRLHLFPDDLVGTGIGSTSSHLQPAPDVEEVPG